MSCTRSNGRLYTDEVQLLTHSTLADHEGSPRVDGDEEEEDIDDLENEFSYTDMDKQDKHEVTEEMLHAHMGYGHDSDVMMTPMMTPIRSQYPLLTNGHMVEPLSMPVIVLHLISKMWFVTLKK